MLKHIHVHQFRNLTHVDISPKQVNLLLGNNGSGKTSFLEATYFLGHGRSFRTTQSQKLIQHESDCFRVLADLETEHGKLGIEKNKQDMLIKFKGEVIRNSSVLVRLLPIQIISPDIHKLLEDSPRHRRKFLEWGVFHVEHSYGTIWKTFQKILKQRNAALKNHWDHSLIKHWDIELESVVEQIHQAKIRYVHQLESVFKQYAQNANIPEPSITYYCGWPKELSYSEALTKSWEQDRESGFTRYGPHRSDLVFKTGVYKAKDVVSRGQQKVFAIMLKLSQVNVFTNSTSRPLVLLIDDLASELDCHFTETVIDLLDQSQCQLFVTATDKNKLSSLIDLPCSTMFHVEHSTVKEMI